MPPATPPAIPRAISRPLFPLSSSPIASQTPKSPLGRRRPISTYGYTQVKSLVYPKYGEPKDVLELHTHSLSPPHSTLLTLRSLATPLNPADVNQIQGLYPSLPPFTTALGTAVPTAIPGNEGCFEILSRGAQCAPHLHIGDWVIAARTGLGTWRTHLQVDQSQVVRVEKARLTARQVAGVTVNPVTAYRLLSDFVRLDAQRGDWFVQNGANSGVGRAAMQLGRRWGWKSIAVVRGRAGAEGEALVRELLDLGATRVVTEAEVMERGFADRVQEWTGGGREKVRLGLNCVGGKAAVGMAKCLAEGAHLVTYGAMSKQPLAIPAGMLIFRNLVFEGFWVSKWGDAHAEEKRRTVEELLALMREGTLRDVPTVEVGWGWGTGREELVEAVQGTLEGYRKGKGMFVYGDT